MLVSFFTSSLRRTVPESRWATYLLARGEWSDIDVNCLELWVLPSFAEDLHQIYEPLGMENKILGFVFLIDSDCKVRWAGCGPASEKEVQSLRESTAVLMKRMEVVSGKTSTAAPEATPE